MPQERHLKGHGTLGDVDAGIGRVSLTSLLLRIGFHLSFGGRGIGQRREMNKVFCFFFSDV